VLTITDRVHYWDHYAAGIAETDRQTALRQAFGWTQYAGHGPGADLLGKPATALELGSGRGNAVAALALTDVDTTGIDLSPTQCETARETWSDIPSAHFHRADASAFLTNAEQQWDVIYSIWGALWYADPAVLLPLARRRLSAGGKLVFSHAPPVPGSYGVQGIYGSGLKGRQVWIYRWAYEPETWTDLLYKSGFADVCARVEPAPDTDHVGTLIVEAQV